MYNKFNNNGQLFFLAYVIEEPFQSLITEMKTQAKEKFDSSHALNSPAHITLLPPFFYDKPKLYTVVKEIEEIVIGFKSFELNINGIGKFGKRVIFVSIEENQNLDKIYFELIAKYAYLYSDKKNDQKFHPHITIAFKDLRIEYFNSAWEYFSSKQVKGTVNVNELSLLIYQNKKWEIAEKFKLYNEN